MKSSTDTLSNPLSLQRLIRMKIRTFTVGYLSTNCYVVNCRNTNEAIIIDPGFDSFGEAEKIFRCIEEEELKVKFIVNTHGHLDHVSGDVILKKKYNVSICIHESETNVEVDWDEKPSPRNIVLRDGDVLEFGDAKLKVIHTPGHTSGSICLLGETLIFTGDTLFAGGIGRTDFLGGSELNMKLSLEKLLGLPSSLIVYPGHGPSTTIGEEKNSNPFLLGL
jgi:hydroxyacylglutathione hydrolase